MYMMCVTGLKRRHAAGARSQVNMARQPRQGITEAQGDKTGHSGVLSCGRSPIVMLWHQTYLRKRATSTSTGQKLFRVI